VLVRRFGRPVWRGLRWRIHDIAAEQAAAATREVSAELARLRGDFQSARRNLRHDLNELRDRTDRMGRYLAALDQRVAMLERPPVSAAPGFPLSLEARDLVDEVRTEHARIRARLTAVSLYEERIGRIEQAVESLAERR
jgi:hypothetical protein